jgi:hypothetical protein
VKPLEDLLNTFWCLMTKGEKYQLKLEDLALLCSVWKNWTVQFCPAEFLSIFSTPCNSGLEDKLYCVKIGVKACNMFEDKLYCVKAHVF